MPFISSLASTLRRQASWLAAPAALAVLGACSLEDAPVASAGGNGGAPAGSAGASGGGAAGASAGSASGGKAQAGAAGSAGVSVTGGTAGSTAGSAGASGGARPSGGAGQGGAPVGGSGSGGTAGTAGAGAAGGGSGAGGSDAGTSGAGAAGVGGAGAGGTDSAGGGAGGVPNGADPKFWIFLLLGQSNMEGTPQPQAQDRTENPRIQVLAYDDCPNLDREYNQWYPASPPLHSCNNGVGPGDYFSKTLIESLPDDHTIGLVPNAVNGAPIDLFRKDVPRTGYDLPPDNHWETGYEWIVSRAEEAQKVGVIRGILFHQGESNNGQADWVGKVAGLVRDLRADLGLGDVPFLAGELYYDGCCRGHNALIAELAGEVTNAHVVSAEGLNGTDQYHFDLAGQREFGKRYAETITPLLPVP